MKILVIDVGGTYVKVRASREETEGAAAQMPRW